MGLTDSTGTAVLLATYNGEKYLGEQLKSLLRQSVSDFKIYIHDDGSKDRTLEIIDEFRKRYPDRIEVLEGTPKGSAKDNFWYMLKSIESDIYFFCDQDDVWKTDKVEKERLRIRSSQEKFPVAVFSDMSVTDDKLNILAPSFIDYIGRNATLIKYTQIIIDNPASGTTICFNRALRDALCDADMDLSKVEMHDGILLATAALLGEVIYIDEPLVLYRQHGNNEMGAVGESVAGKIIRNVSDIISGKWSRRRREFITYSKAAATQLIKLKGIKKRDYKILKAYVSLDRLPKYKRVRFLRRYGFKRNKNTWFMYLWI